MSQRLAGQSFPNGVLIKSKKNWALATDDGDIKFGSSSSWLDNHAFFDVVFIRSIIAFIESIAFTLRVQRDLSVDFGRQFLRPILLYLAVTIPISLLVDKPGEPTAWSVHIGLQVLSFATAFFFFTRAMPSTIWSFHGAEHKAIHAHEHDVDLNDLQAVADCSRVHNRCGTNLVTFLMLASMLRVPSGPPLIALAGTIVYTLLSIGVCIELFRLIVKTPDLTLSRVLLMPGRLLQKFVTTREPDHAQLSVAIKATKMVLTLDEMN